MIKFLLNKNLRPERLKHYGKDLFLSWCETVSENGNCSTRNVIRPVGSEIMATP